jgi:hypothetical protein
MRNSSCVFSLALVALAGCGSGGEGTVEVTAYGEPFIEEGIPASAVDDGWALTFRRFAVTVREVSVGGTPIAAQAPVDLAAASSGAGHRLGAAQVPAGEHTDAGFTLARIEVEGVATKGAAQKTLSWVFDQATRYTDCETTTRVEDAGTATFQVTVHADHLLYDSLVAEEPKLRFQPLADADADGDGAITQAELAGTDIGAYDPGSEDGVDDLWTWLLAQARTLAHVNGEGHCRAATGP